MSKDKSIVGMSTEKLLAGYSKYEDERVLAMVEDKHKWSIGDTVRSAMEVTAIGAGALRLLIEDGVSWVDTKLADRINGEDDE